MKTKIQNSLIKIIVLSAGILVLAFAVSCNSSLPAGNLSQNVSENASSKESSENSQELSEESIISSEESHDETTVEQSPDVSDYSEVSEISDISEISEESQDISQPESIIGDLFAPYYDILKSGEYVLTTTESKTIGGEAVPYTVTAYRRHNVVFAVIEESYGSISEYLVKDSSLIILDKFDKNALILDYKETLWKEKQLWTGNITLTDSGTATLYEKEYNYETYVDSAGYEFTLFFMDNTLERYRSYSEALKDTIVISISVSDDLSQGVFDIPSEYTIIDARG